MRKEKSERCHQGVKKIERSYQRKCDVNMTADYCWMLKKHDPPKGALKVSNKSTTKTCNTIQ